MEAKGTMGITTLLTVTSSLHIQHQNSVDRLKIVTKIRLMIQKNCSTFVFLSSLEQLHRQ